jgi:hypothetical protein
VIVVDDGFTDEVADVVKGFGDPRIWLIQQEILGWMTPASVYLNKINFNKDRKLIKSGHKLCQQNGH